MEPRRTFWVLQFALCLAISLLLILPGEALAGIYNADTEVTYKEYWVPHSEYKGGRNEEQPGCVDTHPGGYAYYIEPAKTCTKTVRLTIPDNFSNALKIELYLDLWRSRTTFAAQFQVNGNVWRQAQAGHDWSRSPYVVEIPKSEFVTGVNTLVFKQTGTTEPYHIHDIGVRIYFDAANPLLNSSGTPISAPNGQLLSVWADNGSFAADAGGSLTVNDDQLVLTADVTTQAKYVEFHGYYKGYDLDTDDRDGDKGALDLEWQNRARNNFQSGGLAELQSGGTIDHIGTVMTPKPGQYSVWWRLPTVQNQAGVKFKLRIVDANNVVREAAGGVSAPFTLSRSSNLTAHFIPNWQDAILYSGGAKPTTITRTLTINTNPLAVQEAYFIGSYWSNPNIKINRNNPFRAFETTDDEWALSVRKINPAWLVQGSNLIVYDHTSGFGEFIEKPGPLIILKPTTQAADNAAPTISGRSPGVNENNVAANSNIVVSMADPGRGVNFNTLKLRVNGVRVDFVRTGTPDEYTLTYDPPTNFMANSTVTVQVEGCDFAGNCLPTTSYNFTVAPAAFEVALSKTGDGTATVSPLQATYNYGDVITLSATADAGWEFSSWSSNRADWWHPGWDFRVPIVVDPAGHARIDKPVEVAVNFTTLLTNLGQNGALNLNSLRLVEVNGSGVVVDDLIPFQFDPASNYNANANASGTLLFMLKGQTAVNNQRTLHLYFDKTGKNFTPVQFTDQVQLTSVVDEFQGSYRIETNNATYYYHLQGGGFSSMVDLNGNDWLDYHDSPPDSGGAFRGLPNMVPPPDGLFHPGKTNHLTRLISSGPLKEVFRTKTVDDKWEVQWEIYPNYATMTVLKRPNNKNYWWLYEGTPGGRVENTGAAAGMDFVTLPNGTSFTLDQEHNADLPGEEWVFISDPDIDSSGPVQPRSIFLIHHTDDNAIDSYRTQTSGNAQSNRKMTIWGFGRGTNTGNTTFMNETPNRFSIGLMDTTAYAAGAQMVNNVYRPLAATVGAAAWRNTPYNPGSTSVLTMTVTSKLEIFANFVPEGSQNALTVNLVGSGSVQRSPNQALYAPNQQVTLTPIPATGWIFQSWSGALTGNANPGTLLMDADKTVTATFIPAAYTVNVSTVGSGSASKNPNQATYPYNSQLSLTATPATGWIFDGWSGDLISSLNPVSLQVDSNKNIVATFAPAQVTLSTVISGTGSVVASPQQATYAFNSVVTLTANPAPGWYLASWSGDLAATDNPTTVVMDGNKTITANFARISHYLHLPVNGLGEVTQSPDKPGYYLNDVVTVTATANPGWLFSGWAGDATGNTNPLAVTINTSKTITANFTAIPYTLLAGVTGSGSIAVDPQQASYIYGDVVTVTATADAGWLFTGWSGALGGTANPITTVITANQVVTANFAAIYTVTVGGNAGGVVTYSPQKDFYQAGEPVTFTATAPVGWKFDHWEGALTGNLNPATLVISADATVTAVFTPLPYLITVSPLGEGTISKTPNKPTYIYSDSLTLQATPAPGWRFIDWGGSLAGQPNPTTITVTGNQEVEAIFERQEVTLTLTVPAGGVVSADPPAPHFVGDVVTLMAQADPGWLFTGWSGDASGSDNPLVLTLATDKSITANFSQEQYTLAVTVNGQGTVDKSPAGPYHYGDVVTLTAMPANGWFFTGWGGALSGSDNPATLTITGNLALNATFTQTPYTVNKGVVGQGTVVLEPDQEFYVAGTVVTVTATPATGWLFGGWSGSLTGMSNPTLLLIDGNKTITATFTTQGYTLATNTTGSGDVTVSPTQATYPHGAQVTLTAVPATGWSFTGWSGDVSGDENPLTLTMTGNRQITANFSQTPLTLVISPNGEGQVVVEPQKLLYTPGEVVTLTAVAALDWRFTGWSGSLSGDVNPVLLTMDGSKNIIAGFVEDTITGEIKSDDFNRCAHSTRVWSWVDPKGDAPQPVVTGEGIQLTVPGGTDHDVWRNGIEAPHLVQAINDTDFEVVAKFDSTPTSPIQLQGILIKGDERNALRVNLQSDGGKSYLFVGLLRGSQSPQRKARLLVESSAVYLLRVHRQGQTWTISYRTESGDWSSDPALSFTHTLNVSSAGLFVGNAAPAGGTPPAFTATVDYWLNTAQPLPGDDPLANHVMTGVVGQGEVTQEPACGNPVRLTATPAAGWAFVRWDETTPAGTRSLGSANPLTTGYGKNTTITAIFEQVDIRLDLAVVGGGDVEVSPLKDLYTAGENVTLTATSQAGWLFAGWSGDLTGTANPAQVTMDGSKSITATFVPGYLLNLSANPVGGRVEVEPAKDRYMAGEEVTLTALPHPGFAFVKWLINGVAVSADAGSTQNPLTITVTEDTTVEVRFTAITTNDPGTVYLPLITTQ